jgi:hypothetical protein
MRVPNDNTMSGLNGNTGTNGARYRLTIPLHPTAGYSQFPFVYLETSEREVNDESRA